MNLNGKIKLFATDCDGVLTDGGMYYFDNGIVGKKFHCHDGSAFQILKENKIKIAIISGESSNSLKNRNNKLACDYLIMNSKNKLLDLKKICIENKISLSSILYVGDDLNDGDVMKNVGFSCCPNDAVEYIKKNANYVCNKNGGCGVIREIVDNFFVN